MAGIAGDNSDNRFGAVHILMLPLLLLSVLLGLSTAFGSIIFQEKTPQGTSLAPNSERWRYSNCTDENGLIELKDISLSPDPPKPGEELEVTASGYVKETLEEGMYADVLVKVGLIKIINKRFDVCEEARNANATIQCPVEPGDYDITQLVELPKEIPPAAFTVSLKVYDVGDRDVLCVNIWMDFRPHPGGLW